MDVWNGRERKILASKFGDDYDAIPAYEQIYALAGPIQTYRVTGDPRILRDAEMTINLFNKFFRDPVKGGYFSHIDPVRFDPHAESLGEDRARKNWNSVGDHAPAYLINLWLATGEDKYADFLVETADTIAHRFPDYDKSPFVQERYDENWEQDLTWGWQQNNAVVGHNLKIAWNLMRINHMRPSEDYVTLAKKIAAIMPDVGMDKQRGGWYDVVSRTRSEGEEWNRFVWHDRKAWWQQEQGILAYLILHGSLKEPEYLRLARESSSFYNAFFPDHDNGGVYFNVLSTGIPYLLGTERLITKQPMDLYFKPQPGAFKDNILRVQPDILPPGSVRLEEVWINGEPYTEFDPVAMTVQLPTAQTQHMLERRPSWTGNPLLAPTAKQEMQVRVRIAPVGVLFDAILDISDDTAQLTMYGNLTEANEEIFQAQLAKIIAAQPKRFVLLMAGLQTISKEAARELSFVSDKLSLDDEIYVLGANEDVKELLQNVKVWEELNTVETV
jgi:N-acylglucosamine 2-epimerase (GlcNAc 2-epimerase)